MNVNENLTKYINSMRRFDPFKSFSSKHPIKYYVNIYIILDQVRARKRLNWVETSHATNIFCLISLTFITIYD